jgi:diguanylate cyclase (GGDEF)-like protein/PAS domain S-box-containing protein
MKSPTSLRPLRFTFSFLVAAFAIVYLFVLYQSWQESVKDTSIKLRHTTKLLAQHTNTSIQNYTITMQSIGRQLVELGTLSYPEYGRELIEQLQTMDKDVGGYSLARLDGTVVLMAGYDDAAHLPSLRDEKTREAFDQAIVTGKITVTRTFYHEVLKNWLIIMRQPVLDDFGEPMAVMSAGFEVSNPNSSWALNLPDHVEIGVLRMDGWLQYFHPIGEENKEERLEELFGQPLDPQVMDQIKELSESRGFTKLDLFHRGGEHYLSFEVLPEHDLLVGSIIPSSVVISQWFKSNLVTTMFFLLSVAGSIIGYRIARRLHFRMLENLAYNHKWYQGIADGADYAIMATDTEGTIVNFNHAAEKQLGYSSDEIVGHHTLDFFHRFDELSERSKELSKELGRKVHPNLDALLALPKGGKPDEQEWQYIRKDGSTYPAQLSISPLYDNDKNIIGYVALANDITERKAAQELLAYQATHDSLTGLPIRDELHNDFERLVIKAKMPSAALMILDLDGFKEINDTLGHGCGDQLLQQVGLRLEDVLKGYGGQLYRLGGDEFGILIPNMQDEETYENIARTTLHYLKAAFPIEHMTLSVSGSIGIALYREDGADSHDLLRCADVAMYEAKRRSAGVVRYARTFDPHSTERLELMGEFKQGIQRGELTLHYQPKYDLSDGVIVGFEALVRWDHPQRGLLYPDAFIDLIELSDDIHLMTLEVITQALEQQKKWREQGLNYSIAINLSPRNLLEDGCIWHIQKLMDRFNTDPSTLEFEITESTLMHDIEGVVKRMRRMADMGLKVSIDDFGTGYSSLGRLRDMPVSIIKIDRSFITNMDTNEHDKAIVKATLDMAAAMDVKIIAEGVETPEVLFMLEEMGCDYIQGFFIGKPMTADEIQREKVGYGHSETGTFKLLTPNWIKK